MIRPTETENGDDAVLAARLLALAPGELGGAVLRGPPGPARDAWIAALAAALPTDAPVRKLPAGASEDRLLGGLDLAATLAAGRPVATRGLLAEADGGILLVAMAERLPAGAAAQLTAALDRGEVVAERDGLGLRHPARFGLVLLDEGIGDEGISPALADRCAFRVDLSAHAGIPPRQERDHAPTSDAPSVDVPADLLSALCEAAAAFGIPSLRAVILAAAVARAHAALDGRSRVTEDDAAVAARLVLAPRATRVPEPQADAEPPPPEPDPAPDGAEPDPAEEREPSLDEVVVEAIRAALPADLLARLAASAGRPRGAAPSGAGAARTSRLRGRPVGSVRGVPRRGARLDLIETLRAAAPWQPLRRKPATVAARRIEIRRDDLRIRRFRERTETTTIFCVDASGSAAFHRLAEAKGAVELLLADCYVRRDRVALVAFRGERADLLLPPTRSLTRAKRSLAALVGGGGTPLALAIDAAGRLAAEVARGGGSPLVVFLTDGRANIGRDGRPGRERADAEAQEAAKAFRLGRASALVVDISPRPGDAAARLAAAMGARHLPLPQADSASLSRIVRAEISA